MTRTHTDREYDNQLRQLRDKLLLMAGHVEHMIAHAIQALVERDAKQAQQTIELDRKVDQAEIEIDELCLLLLAKRQPLASDLRFITLALKMVTDLERIGDSAVNICERAIELASAPPLWDYADLVRVSELVQGMVRDAIDAFVRGDARLAEDVIARDDRVDSAYHALFGQVLQLMLKNPAAVERGIHVQSVAKVLERIADHSTNLAEVVVFMLRGRDIRHLGHQTAPRVRP